MAQDVIDDLLSRLLRALPQAAPLVPRLEADLRAHWGGSTAGYIRARTAQDARASANRTQALRSQLAQGRPMRQACAAIGIGRTTGYRLLGPKKSK